MKLLAYTTQTGQETVTPLSAKFRELSIVYSRHRPGKRLKMYVQRRGSRHFFAYKGSHISDGITAPESLTHILCKTVLKELAEEGLHTVLKPTFKTEQLQPIPLTLVSGICEYPVEIEGREYVIDTFCRFRQKSETDWLKSHECKWSGQIAFEFFHTSGLAANHLKCKDLESAGIPVFQIAVKPGSFFHIDEEELADLDIEEAEERISRHCLKIRNAFKKQIIGVLFNNPESQAFRQARILYSQLEQSKDDYQRLSAQNTEQMLEIEQLRAENSRLNMEKADYYNRLRTVQYRPQENGPSSENKEIAVPDSAHHTVKPFWKRWLE